MTSRRITRHRTDVWYLAVGVLWLSLWGTANAFGQTDSKDAEGQQVTAVQRWLHEYYQQQAATYEFYFDEAKTKRLAFVETPIFRWKQDDDYSGDLFVWTYQGRPQVVGCILASSANGGSRSVAHEFHSLALQGLPRTKMVAGGWQPSAGVKLTPFSNTALPATTPALRLPQMRTLARDFTAVMKHEEKDWELRWLPQPIYRFAAPEAGVIDGGLFAYVWTRGTDPELLLLVECRDEQPQPRWYYAPVNFTTRPLRLTLKDRDVWTSPGKHSWTTGESTNPYQAFYAGRVMVPVDKP